MSLIKGTYPSFTNGISQQSPAIRLPSQGELQDNGYSSPVDGLMKRPPTEWIGRSTFTPGLNPLVHFINRDEVEKYVVNVMADGNVKVFSLLTGVEYGVTNTKQAYLASATPSRMIRALTLADTTFLLNTTKVVGMKSDVTSGITDQAVVWVRQGNYSTTYNVVVNGTTYTYTTPVIPQTSADATDANYIKTEYIAHNIKDGSTAIPSSGHYGSIIHLQSVSTLSVSDSFGDHSMSAVFKKVGKFSDLPSSARNGMVITVSGDVTSEQDDYYVIFSTTDGDDFGPGVWTECTKAGVTYILDEDTLPVELVRNNTNPVTFTVQTAPWANRVVGDLTTSPNPSFVGHTLSDVFLFKNRLGFLSNENIILSRSGNYYNFFRSTLLSVRDDDPIDVSAAHPRVITLHNAVPFQQSLVLFGDQTQMILAGNELLSPKTVNITVATEYESEPYCRPVQAGSEVYFAFNNETYTGLREYYVDGTTGSKSASTITEHCPRYIKGRAMRIAVSTTENVMIVQPDTDRQYVYVYKWLWNGEQKVQSSWSRWSLGPNGTTVLGFDFVGPTLYLQVLRPDGVNLERLSLAPGRVDDNCDFITHLDRRITEAACSVSYEPSRNVTTFTLPYNKQGVVEVVTRATSSPSWKAGVVLGLDARSQTIRLGMQVEEAGSTTATHPRDDNLIVEGPLVLASDGLRLTTNADGYVTVSYPSVEAGSTETTEYWVYINGNRLETESVVATYSTPPTEVYPDLSGFAAWGTGYHPTLSVAPTTGTDIYSISESVYTVTVYLVTAGQWRLKVIKSNSSDEIWYTNNLSTGTFTFEVDHGGTGAAHPTTVTVLGNGLLSPIPTTTRSPITISLGTAATFRVSKLDRVQLYVHNLTNGTHSGFHDESAARTIFTDLTAADALGNTIKVSGDYRGKEVWIGSNYEFRYRLTQPMLRVPSPLGGIEAVTGSRLQVRTLGLDYNQTGYFRVEVTTPGRDVSTHLFTGKVLGSSEVAIGDSQDLTGSFRCFVGAKNDQVTLDVVNDSFRPSRFTGGVWEGLFTDRARRM